MLHIYIYIYIYDISNLRVKYCVPPVVVYSTNVWFISVSNSGSNFEEMTPTSRFLGRIFVNKKQTV